MTMTVKTINLPIYDLDIVVVINDWLIANKRFRLGMDEAKLMNATAWSIEDFMDTRDEIYLLFDDKNLDYSIIIHEIFHVVLEICNAKDIVVDFKNQEPVTYLAGYIGEEVFKIIDKHKKL